MNYYDVCLAGATANGHFWIDFPKKWVRKNIRRGAPCVTVLILDAACVFPPPPPSLVSYDMNQGLI